MNFQKTLSWFKSIKWKKPVLAAVGLLFFTWLFYTPPGLLGKADAIGYAVCHRISSHSFFLGERQLSFCARCTGMYLGAMLGLFYQQMYRRKHGGTPPWQVLIVLGVMVLGFAADGLNSYLHLFTGAIALYQPQNWLRLLTGSGMGLVISAAIFPAFNQSVWKDWHPEPAIDGLGTLARLIILTAILDLVVLTRNPLFIYPLTLVSAAGVLVLLTMAYSMVWLIIFRAENRYLQIREMIFPLSAGFGFALLQIVLLNLGRYILTGTWDGFHIG